MFYLLLFEYLCSKSIPLANGKALKDFITMLAISYLSIPHTKSAEKPIANSSLLYPLEDPPAGSEEKLHTRLCNTDCIFAVLSNCLCFISAWVETSFQQHYNLAVAGIGEGMIYACSSSSSFNDILDYYRKPTMNYSKTRYICDGLSPHSG